MKIFPPKVSIRQSSWLIGFVTICLMGLFLYIAVLSRNFEGDTVWPQFYGALLGMVLSAIITLLLLTGQSRSADKLQKQDAIYREKISVFKDFLDNLYEVIKDGEITPQEANLLKYKVANLALHMGGNNLKTLGENVRELCNKMNQPNAPLPLDILFKIVREFKEELYQDEFQSKDATEEVRKWREIVKNFESLDDVNEREAKSGKKLFQEQDTYSQFRQVLIERTQRRLDSSVFSVVHQNNGVLGVSVIMQQVQGADKPLVRIGNDNNTGTPYFFQLHMEEENTAPSKEYRTLYKSVAWDWGGRNNKWCWWKYIDAKYRELESDELRPLIESKDEILLQYLEDSLVQLATDLQYYAALYFGVWRNLLENYTQEMKPWRVWFDYTTLAFDADNTSDKLCFDVEDKGEDRYRIKIFNRREAWDALARRIKSLGLDYDSGRDADNRFCYAEVTGKEEALKKILEILPLANQPI
ncbi:MAG: hypothetical protein IJ816_04150 [Alloprevotella sp.]|nr:hypothetical protein [Alloprevotella sp.]